MMQKNESEMLPIWASYYANLVGKDNIFIFDNGSTDSNNLLQIADLRNSGFTVIDAPNRSDFERKGLILQDKANELFDDGYKFVYFADADEFLFFNHDEIPASPFVGFDEYLDQLLLEKSAIFRIPVGWMNIPNSTLVYLDKFGSKKIILRFDYNRNLVLDVGFHLYDWSSRTDIVNYGTVHTTKFAIIHFHNKKYLSYINSAKEKLKDRVTDFSSEALQKYNGAGVHLISALTSSESEYYKNLDKRRSNSIDISNLFEELGIAIPNR